MNFNGSLIFLGLFAAVVLSLYFFFSARHKERMALIEKGLYENKQKKLAQKPERPNRNLGLKFGSLSIGVGLGLFFGFVLASFTIVEDVVSYFTMILLFGGASLILNNFIAGKKQADNN